MTTEQVGPRTDYYLYSHSHPHPHRYSHQTSPLANAAATSAVSIDNPLMPCDAGLAASCDRRCPSRRQYRRCSHGGGHWWARAVELPAEESGKHAEAYAAFDWHVVHPSAKRHRAQVSPHAALLTVTVDQCMSWRYPLSIPSLCPLCAVSVLSMRSPCTFFLLALLCVPCSDSVPCLPPTPFTSNVSVTRVTEGLPADDADILRNDIIMDVNGEPTNFQIDFFKAIKACRPGDRSARKLLSSSNHDMIA